jgi:putative FmdB family regulatory protein
MPIYEYECRACGRQFELLVLAGTTPACPDCHGVELDRLLSGFAVSSEAVQQTNIKTARRQFQESRNERDKRVAEAEHAREHIKEYMPPKD